MNRTGRYESPLDADVGILKRGPTLTYLPPRQQTDIVTVGIPLALGGQETQMTR